MKKNRWFLRMVMLLAISAMLNMTISLAAEVGSSEDPLVTLSYLNETFFNKIMTGVDAKIAQRNDQLGGAASSSFAVVTLSSGQTLLGDIGCEVLLRVGTATCVASGSPGLIDESAGAPLAGGSALAQNHLYMMTVEGRGVKATAATVKLLVRGGYTLA